VLPRLASLIDPSSLAKSEGETHCVLATAQLDARSRKLAELTISALGFPRGLMWRESSPPIRSGPTSFDDGGNDCADIPIVNASSHEHPRGGAIVIVGAARSPAAWWARCKPTSVTLIIDEFQACEIIERIRELSSDARRRIALVYVTPDLARRIALPGIVVEE
jgi:hypothetical protein